MQAFGIVHLRLLTKAKVPRLVPSHRASKRIKVRMVGRDGVGSGQSHTSVGDELVSKSNAMGREV